MTKIFNKQLFKQLFFITLGCSIYAFSLDAISIPNKLADGGISGIALLLRYWFHINPGLSTLLLNIPLINIGSASGAAIFKDNPDAKARKKSCQDTCNKKIMF